MRHQERWHDTFKGVRFEISKFKLADKDAWAFYLHLAAEQFPQEIQGKLIPLVYFTAFGTPLNRYSDHPLEDLEWHGGMTWASNETNPESVHTCLKFGCDYQHLWDEGQRYTVEGIVYEVKECIESLYRKFPELIPIETLWEQHRKKFPGEKCGDVRMFNKDGTPMKEPL